MIGTFAKVLLLLVVGSQLLVIGTCVRQGWFRKYLVLNLLLVVNILSDLVRGCALYTFGYTSPEYFYAYLYTDAVLSVLSYLLIVSFFDAIFRQSIFRRYVRPTLGFLFVLIIALSALALSRTTSHVTSRMYYEIQQNLYFAGLLLNFFLWVSLNHLRVESKRLALLVAGLGIFFASNAAKYSFHYLFQGTALSSIATSIPPVAFLLMVSLWAYTFLRVPEDMPAAEPASQGEGLGAPVRLEI